MSSNYEEIIFKKYKIVFRNIPEGKDTSSMRVYNVCGVKCSIKFIKMTRSERIIKRFVDFKRWITNHKIILLISLLILLAEIGALIISLLRGSTISEGLVLFLFTGIIPLFIGLLIGFFV